MTNSTEVVVATRHPMELVFKQGPANLPIALEEVTDGLYISEIDDKIKAIIRDFNPEDRLQIISFGGEAQKETAKLADEMIDKAKSSEVGEVGEVIGNFLTELRGYGIEKQLNPSAKTLFDRITDFLSGNALMRFLSKYETIKGKITETADRIVNHRNKLHKDTLWLNKAYDATETYYLDLERYIIAGRLLLMRFDAEISERKSDENLLDAHKTNDLVERRGMLDRTLGDLNALRHEAHDTLGQIRVMINGDTGMMQKLERIIRFTIPAWKRQIALAMTIMNQQGAATISKQISEATNKILRAKADALKGSAADVATEMERSVFDADTLVYCTDTLIATMTDVLRIHADGAKRRAEDAKLFATKQETLRNLLLKRSVHEIAAHEVAAQLPRATQVS